MKKTALIVTMCAVACAGLLSACGAGGPSYSGDDAYINENWQLSGKLSDYYFVDGAGQLCETLPETVTEVGYGDNVFVNAPVVIDGKGNVLNVSQKISLREGGAEVTLSGGSFFALDACGYTVDFTITLVSGTTENAQKTIIVRGAENIWREDTLTIDVNDLAKAKSAMLVNTERKTSYDLTKLLSVDEQAKLGEYAQKGTVTWNVLSAQGESVAIAGTNFDLSANGAGVYTVYAQYTTDNYSLVAFADVVKFYDSSTSLVEGDDVIGVEELTVKKQVKLLNLDDEDAYNLNDLLTSAEKAAFAEYRTQGEIVWNLLPVRSRTAIEVDGELIDFTQIDKANYGVYAHFIKDGVKEVVYGANVDFYDENDLFVWSTVSEKNVSLINVSGASELERTSVSIADPENSALSGGTYYQITSTGGSEAYTLDFTATHSKEYYQTFKGLNVYVTFDMYMEATANDPTTETVRAGFFSADGIYVNNEYYSTADKHRGQISPNTWYTVKMPLDSFLLENWQDGMLHLESGFDVNGSMGTVQETKLYVGNVQIGQDVSDLASDERMLNLQGQTQYNLLTLFDAQTQETIANISGAKWTLYPVRGGAGIEVDSTVDFTQTPKGYYTVSVVRGQFVVCGTNVDFYDSADGFEWNTTYDANAVVIKSGKATAEVVSDPKGAKGAYYKISTTTGFMVMVSPSHSDEYYSSYQGKGISLLLDYYLDTTSNGTNVVFCGYTGGKQRTGSVWHTETIALDTLLTHWDSLNDAAKKDDWKDVLITKVTSEAMDVYVGNIRFDVTVEGAVQDTTVRLANFDGNTSYDLTKVLQASGVESALYADDAVAWTLTPVSKGNTAQITGNVATLTAVEKRAYNATANITRFGKEITIYTGVIDFYDDADGVVFNLNYDADDITIKLDKAKVTKAVASNPAGRTGSYYQITTENEKFHAIIAFAHTKEYYQMMSEQTVAFDVYVASAPTVDTLMAFATNTIVHVMGSQWKTVTISVQALLDNWDNIFNAGRTNDWKDAILMTRDATSTTIYFGNFRTTTGTN